MTAGLRRLAVTREAAVTADPHGPGLLHVHLDGSTEAVTRPARPGSSCFFPPTGRTSAPGC